MINHVFPTSFPGSSLLDEVARVPWFKGDVRAAIRVSFRRAGNKWRRTKLPEHLAAFKTAKKLASHLLNTAKTKYLSDFICENSDNQRKLLINS